jgi:hypothetical protein
MPEDSQAIVGWSDLGRDFTHASLEREPAQAGNLFAETIAKKNAWRPQMCGYAQCRPQD